MILLDGILNFNLLDGISSQSCSFLTAKMKKMKDKGQPVLEMVSLYLLCRSQLSTIHLVVVHFSNALKLQNKK